MRIEAIATERLLLRPLSVDDAPDLFAVYADVETMRYWPTRPHMTLADTRGEIRQLTAPEGASYWCVCVRTVHATVPIGVCGFLGNAGVPGAGYILHRDYWRQGYGTEALRAMVAYGFEHLKLDRIELWIDEENLASQRLAQKAGFERRSQFRLKWHNRIASHVMAVYGLYAPVKSAPAQPVFDRLTPILAVGDVQATAEYYRDALGFAIEFLYGRPATHAAVARGDWTHPSARIQFSHVEGAVDSRAMALFISVGPGADALCASWRAAGVEIVSDPQDKPWGMREFSIRDCNGYLLRFATPV